LSTGASRTGGGAPGSETVPKARALCASVPLGDRSQIRSALCLSPNDISVPSWKGGRPRAPLTFMAGGGLSLFRGTFTGWKCLQSRAVCTSVRGKAPSHSFFPAIVAPGAAAGFRPWLLCSRGSDRHRTWG